jgi:cob(I)alamin adenosyltransferase
MSISTAAGDDGSTELRGGERVAKDAPRIECLGALDELNAFLGDARCTATGNRSKKIIETIQGELFIVAGILARPAGSEIPESTGPDEERITAWVHEFEKELPFRGFIVPGANPAAAKLDIARTVCRRTERRLISLDRLEGIPGQIRRYMNRLSDLLFVLARHEERDGCTNHRENLL